MNTITTKYQQNFKGIERVLLGKKTLSLKNNLQNKYKNNVFGDISILSKSALCREKGFFVANVDLKFELEKTKLSSLKKYLVKLFVKKDAKKYIDSLFAKIKDAVFIDNESKCNEVLRIRMRQMDIENELNEIDRITKKQGKAKPTGKNLAKQKTLQYETEKLDEKCKSLLKNIRQNVIYNTDLAIKNGVDEQDARKLTKYNTFIKD